MRLWQREKVQVLLQGEVVTDPVPSEATCPVCDTPDGDHLDWCTPQAREQRPLKDLPEVHLTLEQTTRAAILASEIDPSPYRAARLIVHLQDENKVLREWHKEAVDAHSRIAEEIIQLRKRASTPPREYPDPVTAFEKLAAALPEGFQFPAMEPNTEPLTHQEIFTAVHHHASEIVRLTAAVPVQCKPETTEGGQK